jgi:hypothetical protein
VRPRVRRRRPWVPWEPNPAEVFLLGLCAISGAGGLADLAVNGHTDGQPAAPLAATWYLVLLLGGLAALAGAYWRDVIDGALVMRAAMWPVGCGAGAYTVVLLDQGQVYAAAITLAFGALCLLRARQLAHHAAAALTGPPKDPGPQ